MSVKYPGLLSFVVSELKNGTTNQKIFQRAVSKFGYNNSYESFRGYLKSVRRRYLTEKTSTDKFIELLQKNDYLSLDTIRRELGFKKNDVFKLVDQLKKSGYEIINLPNNKFTLSSTYVDKDINVNRLEDTEIIFGVASDLHFGSKACQITALHEFCNICKKEGVKYIFSPGDVVAGYNVYPGQMFDVYALSSEEQEKSVIKNLPTGFTWLMMGGNHDYSFIKKGGGHNPLAVIANNRNDVIYTGFDSVNIPILKNVDLKMWHPTGSIPYSISYRLQKGVEQLAFNELRDISSGAKDNPTLRFVLAGHLHIQMQAMFGSIFGMQCGTFEGVTNFLKAKGLMPTIGGWIVKASLNKNGLLNNFDAKFHMFREIEDDWKNYKHSIDLHDEITKPLFDE